MSPWRWVSWAESILLPRGVSRNGSLWGELTFPTEVSQSIRNVIFDGEHVLTNSNGTWATTYVRSNLTRLLKLIRPENAWEFRIYRMSLHIKLVTLWKIIMALIKPSFKAELSSLFILNLHKNREILLLNDAVKTRNTLKNYNTWHWKSCFKIVDFIKAVLDPQQIKCHYNIWKYHIKVRCGQIFAFN